MSISKDIAEYLTKFSVSGTFELNFEDTLKQVITSNQVPNKPGVYLIMSVNESGGEEIIYIGKSGTLNNNGSFKPQGISVRLTKKQEGIYRQEFFRQVIKENGYKKLKFNWVVTYNSSSNLIPQKVEGDLIQIYFENKGRLPQYNKSY